MFDEFLARVSELRSKGESFAIAIVVRYEAPISGKPGDKAIIRTDGSMWGWIGGGCSQPAVIREALKALEDGKPRLIRISPSAEPEAKEGVVDYTMTCVSGGALDIYIEPILPKPEILIIGRSPVAQTLAALGKAIGYKIAVIAPGARDQDFTGADSLSIDMNLNRIKVGSRTYVVVSTQGEFDEEALEQVLNTGAPYVAFVGSKIKTRKILDCLRERGGSPELLSRVRAPAGLDIGASSPEEIAVSILAEIIRTKRSKPQFDAGEGIGDPLPVRTTSEAVDPICGMRVDAGKARYKSEYQQNTFFFCCSRCKQTFDGQPDRYAVASRA